MRVKVRSSTAQCNSRQILIVRLICSSVELASVAEGMKERLSFNSSREAWC